jgi:hypothetical protein
VVALPHPALETHHLIRALDEQPAVLAVPPCDHVHGQQGRAPLCDGGQHAVAAHGVECVPPVDLDDDAARVSERTGAQGATDDLAATRDAHCEL